MLRLAAFTVTALLVGGCYSAARLHENSDEAMRRLVDVRPRADVSNIEPGLWMSERDHRVAKSGLEDSLIHSAGRLLREQLPLLLRLGLLTEADVNELDGVAGLGDAAQFDAAQFGAFAVPETGRFFVKPGQETVELCIHEIAHIVSYRFGYMDGWPVLLRGDVLDARWIDTDALLAAWALDEAVAELTEEIATLQAEGGDAREFWAREVPLGRRLAAVSATGPLTLTYPDGRVFRLESGTYVREASSIAIRLLNFVYRASPQAVTRGAEFPAADDGALDLDLAFADTWRAFSFTTRQVLFPEGEHRRSRFAERFRQADLEVAGATRVGAFAVHEFVMRQARFDLENPLGRGAEYVRLENWSALSDRLRGLHDDILLRDADDALLWISQWESEDAAQWFADVYQAANPEAVTRRQDRHVIINAGGFNESNGALVKLFAE